MMKKLVFGAFAFFWFSTGWAANGKAIANDIFDRLKMSRPNSLYPDSTIYRAISQTTIAIQSITLSSRSRVKITLTPTRYGWRKVLSDSAIKIISVFRRRTPTDTLSNLESVPEADPEKLGNLASNQSTFTQERSGDTLILIYQPTPQDVDTIWAEVAHYSKSYRHPADSAIENPLPHPWEDLVAPLAAYRLLRDSPEADFRAFQMAELKKEFFELLAAINPNLIDRFTPLWILPGYIKATEPAERTK